MCSIDSIQSFVLRNELVYGQIWPWGSRDCKDESDHIETAWWTKDAGSFGETDGVLSARLAGLRVNQIWKVQNES